MAFVFIIFVKQHIRSLFGFTNILAEYIVLRMYTWNYDLL